MPYWDFKCPSCGNIQRDIWVSNWRDALGGEPNIGRCGCGAQPERMPAVTNFILKGSGWTPKGTR